MEFDEEKYETKSTSDYWSDVVRGIETLNEEEEPEDEENVEKPIFRCSKCGFLYDLNNPPENYHPFGYYVSNSDPSKIKCPSCGKMVAFETVTKEKYEELIKKAQKKKEELEQRKEERARDKKIDQIKDDLKELAEDLKDRLFSKEITPKRFVAIFTYMSKNIVNRYSKDLDIDWLGFRKTIFELSDGILEVYKESEKSEEILEEYTEDINQDELYKAELEYYIEDNKFSIPDYELRKRIYEYEQLQKDIRSEEYKKEIEEKYQKRRNTLLQKAEERERRQKLRDIM
ncbi:MAG: hypothetical protein J6A15_02135 [Clostridia bacterium]|nr:hypothetical protein [Clostridia bacterium]